MDERGGRVQFGFCLPCPPPGSVGRQGAGSIDEMERALHLIAGHFDSVWMVDHLQGGDGEVLESVSALAYLAGRHPRLRFGHSVLCQSYRNPALLAKVGATLQVLSDGRYIMGIGAGWDAEEYAAYGYDYPPAGVRVDQLEEALQIIRALWREERVSFTGRHYRVAEARCIPRPTPPPPLMVGAFKPRMLRLAARYADWWDVSSTGIGRYGEMVATFERACLAVGRDPATIRRSTGGGCACAPTRAEAEALAGDLMDDDEDDFNFVGTPDELVEQMRAFIALGVDYFILGDSGYPDLSSLQLLIDEVLPALNG